MLGASRPSVSTENRATRHWEILHQEFSRVCESTLQLCAENHTPLSFSLKLLVQMLVGWYTSPDQPDESISHFWNTDLLAALLLRSLADQLYANRPAKDRPELVLALMSEASIAQAALLLQLPPQEVSWSALYAHFLQLCRQQVARSTNGIVNLSDLGSHLVAHLYMRSDTAASQGGSELQQPPQLQSEDGEVQPVSAVSAASHVQADQQTDAVAFWTQDTLALLLLQSVITRFHGRPQLAGVEPEQLEMQAMEKIAREQLPALTVSIGKPAKPRFTPEPTAAPVAGTPPSARPLGPVEIDLTYSSDEEGSNRGASARPTPSPLTRPASAAALTPASVGVLTPATSPLQLPAIREDDSEADSGMPAVGTLAFALDNLANRLMRIHNTARVRLSAAQVTATVAGQVHKAMDPKVLAAVSRFVQQALTGGAQSRDQSPAGECSWAHQTLQLTIHLHPHIAYIWQKHVCHQPITA